MLKKEYAAQIAQIMGVETNEVEKANGVILTGIMIPTGKANVKATVYIDRMYEDGLTVDEAIDKINEIIDRERNTQVDIDFINDFENVRPLLRARLYNKATKADIFRSAAPYGFNDLIIVPYIENVIKGGSIKVTNGLLKVWGISADEVMDIAEENAKNDVDVKSMLDMLMEYGHNELENPDPEMPQMIVVTNGARCFGAYGIIAKLDEFKDKFGSFTVLPSSVHEVIVVNQIDDAMNAMVNEVNDTQVDVEEQLSNHAYTFVA